MWIKAVKDRHFGPQFEAPKGEIASDESTSTRDEDLHPCEKRNGGTRKVLDGILDILQIRQLADAFFTAGEDEVRAWPVRSGSTAQKAAFQAWVTAGEPE